MYHGRVGRRRFTIIILVAGIGLTVFVSAVSPEILNSWYVLVPFYLVLVPLSYYITCLYIKRLHDIGMSGYYALLLFIPSVVLLLGNVISLIGERSVILPVMVGAGIGQLISMILTLILVFKRGEMGENKFGLPSYKKG